MTHLELWLAVGAGVLALVAAAFLLLVPGAEDEGIARRIRQLRQGSTEAGSRSPHLGSVLISLMRHLGNAMRDRMLSPRDAEALARTLAASGLEPSKTMPIFIGAKLSCLLGVPTVVYFGTVILGYPTAKQTIYAGLSLVVGMMMPNWVIALIRRPYQGALRRGIPDALDLMVVCAEAGLGLESAVERVAQEMKQSNRPLAFEFSLLTHEMRIMTDRRIALTNFAERTGQSGLRRLAGTIAQTMQFGTPLSQGLRTLAADMRNERMIQFEERAGKLPALLVIPMIVFILPCLFIIMMGQPVSQLFDTLATMTIHR